MSIKTFIRKIVYGNKADSDTYISFLREKGMRIGENVTIYVPTKTSIDETRPWMIEIGNNVEITEGVTILTHGYDWSVIKAAYGDVLGSAGEVVIGNNVFIGMHTTILKGVKVGDNCVIGAGSLLTSGKVFPDNSIIVGNPARVIGNLSDYYEKRKKEQLVEAEECYRCYKKSFKKIPNKEIFREFFWLFESRNEEALCDEFKKVMKLGGGRKYQN